MSRPDRRRLDVAALRCLLALILALAVAQAVLSGADRASFSGERAFADLKKLVSFGPRPPGSKALGDARQWMIRQLKETGAEVEEDPFLARTPVGNVPMTNVIAKFAGARSEVIMLAGHYDTKRFDGFSFVGANDGGSSAAFLLEMARVLRHRKNSATYWLVFFDGEEAFGQWSAADSLYGSRHLAQTLTNSGKLGALKAMILLDMIGDASLDIYREGNSTGWLNDLVFGAAHRLGYSKEFLDAERPIEDDHVPFLNAGVPAIDLIDFDYGPGNSYWHNARDTIDHCSPTSLQTVGRVVAAALSDIENSPHFR